MEAKKISFGFMKTKKVEKPIVEEKKDYIECLEEKSIKVVGGETIEEEKPLIIPMKPNTLITAERLKEIAEKVEKDLEEPEAESKPAEEKETPTNETLDQMVVRELLQEAKKETVETAVLTVPIPALPVIDGQKESTLDDYEAVPIQDFGLAMLRGMGWTASKDQSKYKQPQLRPKGLGLGADKVVTENQKKKSTKGKEEELSIVKNSFVKITTGKYSGYYGKVVSLDEDNGRVMVDITIKKETVSLSEFMMHPVTKAEFDKESKVINQGSYEEYKKNEKSQKPRQESPKVEREPSSSNKSYNVSKEHKKEKREESKSRDHSSNGKNRDRSERHKRDSSSSEDRSRRKKKKEKKRYSSNESLSSLSESEKRKKHKSKKRHSSESDSDSHRRDRRHRSGTPEGKRDIDKKRKGKKKKRDRDRSPNYRKHRK